MGKAGPNTELSYAVRPRTVGKYCGDLLCVLAALDAVPALVAFGFDGWTLGIRYAAPVVVMLAAGLLLRRLRPAPRIQVNEALVVTAAGFLLAAAAMVTPFMTAGLPARDALFEAVSGITTTGLSTTASVADKPISFLFTRAYLQWYGGLGIVVLSVALVMRPGAAIRRLAVGEESVTDLAEDTRTHARQVLTVYGSLTAITMLALFLTGIGPLAAITYAFSAVSTGGFSIHDASLAGVAGWVPRTIVLFSALLGAISFTFYYRWLHGTAHRPPWRDLNVLGLLVAVLLVGAALALCLHYQQGRDWNQAVRQGISLGVSAQTTTGFSTSDVSTFSTAAKAIQMLAMFVGGDIGSTAGGI
ncbi:MAG TPA: potassium transporter TrkG, partial [Phycisphaerae bacterium]|nr:potassium transporter TrkG [Phycisphaerae bacterium]